MLPRRHSNNNHTSDTFWYSDGIRLGQVKWAANTIQSAPKPYLSVHCCLTLRNYLNLHIYYCTCLRCTMAIQDLQFDLRSHCELTWPLIGTNIDQVIFYLFLNVCAKFLDCMFPRSGAIAGPGSVKWQLYAINGWGRERRQSACWVKIRHIPTQECYRLTG